MSMRSTAGLAVFLLSVCASTTAFAHHAFAAVFSRDLPIEVTGTVTRVEWMNPHARFYVEADDGDGETVEWDFELASPNTLMRRGWRHDSLKPGDVVTVSGHRARNATHVGNASSVELADGSKVFSSPQE